MITLSIIIPVYNEEKTIASVLAKLSTVKLPSHELIVVDDGSTDRTYLRIKNYELGIKNKIKSNFIKVISHKTNLGKGSAIQTGIKAAKGKYILLHDADLEYNPADIPALLKALEKGDNIAVYGSRFLSSNASIPLLYLFGNKFLTWLTNVIYNVSLTDMETGYKLLPANFIKKIKFTSNHFEIEPEITIKLIGEKIKIIEVPISYKSRSHLAGKKLTAKDAWAAIRKILSLRFKS